MTARIARVFVRRTSATPDDDLAFIGGPPLWRVDCDAVHVSAVFTWDIPAAGRICKEWRMAGYDPLSGGPAFNSPAGEFEPGLYLKKGKVITSRGCIRRCPFCFVPKREGRLKTLMIKDGHDVLDNNLLACPREHIAAVFDMLEKQKEPARFTGGLDARLAEPWYVARLAKMRIQCLFTAYDVPSEKEPVERFIKNLRAAGLSQRQVCCYVLCGQQFDSIEAAEERMRFILNCGGLPFAMYFRDENSGEKPQDWGHFVRSWIRPAAILGHRKDAP